MENDMSDAHDDLVYRACLTEVEEDCGAELPVDTKRKLQAFARLCIINSGGDPDAPNASGEEREV
jgi:hypothetical protein